MLTALKLSRVYGSFPVIDGHDGSGCKCDLRTTNQALNILFLLLMQEAYIFV